MLSIFFFSISGMKGRIEQAQSHTHQKEVFLSELGLYYDISAYV